MTKEWSHLPNAKHIDWVLKTLEKDSEMWEVAWDVAWEAEMDSAWDAARDAACDAVRDDAAWDAVWDAVWDATSARRVVWDAVWDAMWDAIEALIAWDDSSKLLDKSIEEVTKLAREGNHAAVLLLPAVIVKHKLKEKNSD